VVNKLKLDGQAMAKPADIFDEFVDKLEAVEGIHEIYAEYAVQTFYLTLLVRSKHARKTVQASVDTLLDDFPEAPIEVEVVLASTAEDLCKQQEALADHLRIRPA
jgi:hypothetical protein